MLERLIAQNKPLIICSLSMVFIGTVLIYGVMKSGEFFSAKREIHRQAPGLDQEDFIKEAAIDRKNKKSERHLSHQHETHKEYLDSDSSEEEHAHFHENEQLLGKEVAEKVVPSPINDELTQLEEEYYAKEDTSFEEHQEYLDSVAEVYENEGLYLHYSAE